MAARSSARFRPSKQRPGPGFAAAIGRMKAGEVLRLEFNRSKPAWTLGDEPVAFEVVSMLLAAKEIESDPDSLFPGAPAQVWRAVRDKEEVK